MVTVEYLQALVHSSCLSQAKSLSIHHIAAHPLFATLVNDDRCGPCRFIGPVFEAIAKENPDAEFVKVDVDEAEEVAAACSIQAMPTFHFYKGGKKIAEMMGADESKLKNLVAQHK